MRALQSEGKKGGRQDISRAGWTVLWVWVPSGSVRGAGTDSAELKKALAKSEAAYRRELLVENAHTPAPGPVVTPHTSPLSRPTIRSAIPPPPPAPVQGHGRGTLSMVTKWLAEVRATDLVPHVGLLTYALTPHLSPQTTTRTPTSPRSRSRRRGVGAWEGGGMAGCWCPVDCHMLSGQSG